LENPTSEGKKKRFDPGNNPPKQALRQIPNRSQNEISTRRKLQKSWTGIENEKKITEKKKKT